MTLQELSDPHREPMRTDRVAPSLHLTVLEDMASAREPWQAVAARSDNVFATWEWSDVWWRHFGRRGRLCIVVCRDDSGAVRVLVPLYVSKTGPLRVLRFVGHGPADQLGPVCATADAALGPIALAMALRTVPHRWDLFLGERMPAEQAWEAVPRARVVRWEASPWACLDGRSWEDWLMTRSAGARQQMRRFERRLERRHRLEYRRCTSEAELDGDLDTLFALHEARWEGDSSSAFSAERRRFHREWASVALARGWLRLWTLELDGRPAAAVYGFRFGDSDAYYQAGRDPGHHADSVGFVLLVHAVRDAAERGVRRYLLLLGDERYKDRFADENPGLETILVPATLAGRLTGRGAMTLADTRPGLRRVVGRLARKA
jgi:CelD/BcsL family acetyltransferase involved in cellulose biosynthesis